MVHQISGQYLRIDEESTNCSGIRNLHIDIDGEHPLNLIIGELDGSTGHGNILGSVRFRVYEKIEKGETLELTCNREETNSSNVRIKSVKIEVPLGKQSQDISVHCYNKSGGSTTELFRKTSPYFRSVTLEYLYEEATQPLCPYDRKALVSPSMRTEPLTIEGAFAEAGIKVTQKEGYSPIAHPKSEGSAWTVEELQAMHIPTSNATPPQESIWLLSAHEYVINTVKGLRIVDAETGKVGCVVFQNATGWETPEEKRLRLFIYMHELGHCLNLKHPWEQIGSAGYSTLSWMNYPWRYGLSEQEYGSEAFWRKFNFEFSNFELLKLRHGF